MSSILTGGSEYFNLLEKYYGVSLARNCADLDQQVGYTWGITSR